MAIRWRPGRCCGCGCTIFVDDFNRDDDEDLGSDWIDTYNHLFFGETSLGDSEIADGRLRFSSANALAFPTFGALYGVTYSGFEAAAASGEVSFVVRADTDGDVARIVFGVWSIRFYFGTSSKIQIVNASNVVIVECSMVLATATDYAVRVVTARMGGENINVDFQYEGEANHCCKLYVDDVLAAYTYDAPGIYSATPLAFGIPAGLALGTLSCAGNIDFDDFAISQKLAEPELQAITITGAPTGGTFTLSYEGQTSAPIARNASPATVRAALEALSTIDAGDLTSDGGNLPTGPAYMRWSWERTYENPSAITGDGSGLTGGTLPAVVVTQKLDRSECPSANDTCGNWPATDDAQHLKLVLTGTRCFAGWDGTYYADPVGAAFSDSLSYPTGVEDATFERTYCQAWEVDVSLSLGGSTIDKIRIYPALPATSGGNNRWFVDFCNTSVGDVLFQMSRAPGTGLTDNLFLNGCTDAIDLEDLDYNTNFDEAGLPWSVQAIEIDEVPGCAEQNESVETWWNLGTLAGTIEAVQ